MWTEINILLPLLIDSHFLGVNLVGMETQLLSPTHTQTHAYFPLHPPLPPLTPAHSVAQHLIIQAFAHNIPFIVLTLHYK